MEICYKATHSDNTCTMGDKPYQYQTGVWMTPVADGLVLVGENGLHACLCPLGCLNYYSLGAKPNLYLAVADGDISEDDRNTRISCTKLMLCKQLSLLEFVEHSLAWLVNNPMLQVSSSYIVQDTASVPADSFAIVTGKNPVAKGKKGAILGFLTGHGRKKSGSVLVVDGKNILEDVYYTSSGTIAKGTA